MTSAFVFRPNASSRVGAPFTPKISGQSSFADSQSNSRALGPVATSKIDDASMELIAVSSGMESIRDASCPKDQMFSSEICISCSVG